MDPLEYMTDGNAKAVQNTNSSPEGKMGSVMINDDFPCSN